MGIRPSELYGVTWPLAAFYFDRGVRAWANYVDGEVNKAEAVAVKSTRRMKGDPSGFVVSAKMLAFNKALGLDKSAAFAAPPVVSAEKPGTTVPLARDKVGKIDLDKINGWPVGRK
jgi:hypothetical protein